MSDKPRKPRPSDLGPDDVARPCAQCSHPHIRHATYDGTKVCTYYEACFECDGACTASGPEYDGSWKVVERAYPGVSVGSGGYWHQVRDHEDEGPSEGPSFQRPKQSIADVLYEMWKSAHHHIDLLKEHLR